MPKGKIKYPLPYKAREIFAVLIKKEKPSRSYSKADMREDLKTVEMQAEFLKVCMELDDSENLNLFRKGLLLILQETGISHAAKSTKIPRTTIYRMLWKSGNPNLKYLILILKYLGLNLWVVTSEFIATEPSKRFKHENRHSKALDAEFAKTYGNKGNW